MIWLLRHAEAEADAADDASRRLTPKGEEQARIAGRALAALGVEIDLCMTSPKARALETARLACAELGGVVVEESEALRGGEFDPDGLTAGRGSVLLVGHEPDFSGAVQRATGARVDLGKASLAAVEDGVLHALLRRRELRAIAGG